MVKILNLDLVIVQEYQKAKGYTPIWCEEVFVIKKLKILFRGLTLLMI